MDRFTACQEVRVAPRKTEDRRDTADEEDRALGRFLDLLEADIDGSGERVVFVTEAFARHLEKLTAGVDVEYDAPIEGGFRL